MIPLWICLPVWRELKLQVSRVCEVSFVLWICLPVWRELKLFRQANKTHHQVWLWICLPVWRELKLVANQDFESVSGELWICLPVWRELKLVYHLPTLLFDYLFGYAFPFEGNWNSSVLNLHETRRWTPLDMPSRLKGIETGIQCFQDYMYRSFGYAFPFEGNWNPPLRVPYLCWGWLWICLPVWRELKLSSVDKHVHLLQFLWICLPVWRELKRATVSLTLNLTSWFLWICLPVWRELKLWLGHPVSVCELTALDMPSRLKGIETSFHHYHYRCRYSFGYAFPFEGNWNKEWLIIGCSVVNFFGYAFPFEGNWNLLLIY